MESPLNKLSPHLITALLAVTLMQEAPASHAATDCPGVTSASQQGKMNMAQSHTEMMNKSVYGSPTDLASSSCLDAFNDPSALASLTIPSLSGLATNLVNALIDTVCDEASNLYNTGINNLNQAISDTLSVDLPYGLGGAQVSIDTGGDNGFDVNDANFQGEQFINDLYK